MTLRDYHSRALSCCPDLRLDIWQLKLHWQHSTWTLKWGLTGPAGWTGWQLLYWYAGLVDVWHFKFFFLINLPIRELASAPRIKSRKEAAKQRKAIHTFRWSDVSTPLNKRAPEKKNIPDARAPQLPPRQRARKERRRDQTGGRESNSA